MHYYIMSGAKLQDYFSCLFLYVKIISFSDSIVNCQIVY